MNPQTFFLFVIAVAAVSLAHGQMDHRSQADIAIENHESLMERLGLKGTP